MSYTKQDCLDEILDISTNTQASNQSCRILGVDCQIDSSLADLSTNISLIDAENHPMIDLPWIMADGSSGFILANTVTKARNVDATVALVPSEADNNNRYIVGMIREHGGSWGLNQMDKGMRARLRLEIPPGTSADTNNYAGVNSQWSSSFPYYQPMKFAMSKLSNSNYQCSLYNGNSWIHAGSGMAQASTSTYNNYICGVFAIPRINDNSIVFPYDEGRNSKKGTILYEVAVSTGAYDSSSNRSVYEPKLYWDANYGKYRPVLYDSSNRNMSSFATDGIMDNGADHMYYIDRSIGLEPISSFSGTAKTISTDIYNNPNYTFFVRFKASGTGSVVVLNTSQGLNSTRLAYSTWSGGSVHYTQFHFYENRDTNVKVYDGITSYETVNTCIRWCMKTNTSNVSRCNISVNTTSSFWTRANYSCAKNSLTDRGTFNIVYSASSFVYWFMVLDENNEMIHYLVPCTYNGDVVYYDVLTKTIYS